jgi:hypothetical protein
MAIVSKAKRTHLVHFSEPLTSEKLVDRQAVCGAGIPRAQKVHAFDDLPVGPGARLMDERTGLFCQGCLAKDIPDGHIYAMRMADEVKDEI